MIYFAVFAFLAAAAAVPLDFQPSVNVRHPALDFDGRAERIVGGAEVPPHEVPYQAAIFIGDKFCAGSLINERYVLTSAQCVYESNRPVIVLGAHRIREKENEQISVTASKTIIHPHWNNLLNDIALVMLPQSIRYTNAIRPIKLAPSNAGTFERDPVRVTGWGITYDGSKELSPVLRYIINPIENNRVCEKQLQVQMNAAQMCLSGNNRRAPCLGDGGAPVVANYQNDLVQVGIVSFMRNECERNYPVGLTRISSHYNWIMASM